MRSLSAPYLIELLSLHRQLIFRSIVLDIVFGICSALFLLLPLHVLAVSLENLSFLVLLMFFAVFFQIHFYKNYCGGITYYLMLPIKRLTLVVILLVNSVLPLLISLVLFSGIQLLSVYNVDNTAGSVSFSDKLLYVSLVLILIKVLPLPIFALAKRHLALVPLFLLSLGLLYLSISFLEELISSVVQVPAYMVIVVFLCCIVFICGKIIAGMKMV